MECEGKYGLAKVNFFSKEERLYVGCMKHCQKMGGRSPPVRNKTELDDMKGMLADLRTFPPFPKSLFLSVTGSTGNEIFGDMTLEHWPKDIREAKDGLWRDYYTGEKLENYNEIWKKTSEKRKYGSRPAPRPSRSPDEKENQHCANVLVGKSDKSLHCTMG